MRSGEAEEFVRCRNVKAWTEGYGGLIGKLRPNETYVDYDFLLPVDNDFLFRPGDYEVRAGFNSPYSPQLGEVSSTVLPISIKMRDSQELVELIRSTHEVWRTVAVDPYRDLTALVTAEKSEVIESLESQLSRSYLRTTLIWTRMIREYDSAQPCAQQQKLSIENLRRVVDPVTADVIAIKLASRLETHKQWKLALTELAKIDGRNARIESNRRSCEYYLEQEGKAVDRK